MDFAPLLLRSESLRPPRSSTSPPARGRSRWPTWVAQGARELSLATSNAQHAIDRLVDDGVLLRIGKGARDRVWEAPEVITALDGFAKRAKRRLGLAQ